MACSARGFLLASDAASPTGTCCTSAGVVLLWHGAALRPAPCMHCPACELVLVGTVRACACRVRATTTVAATARPATRTGSRTTTPASAAAWMFRRVSPAPAPARTCRPYWRGWLRRTWRRACPGLLMAPRASAARRAPPSGPQPPLRWRSSSGGPACQLDRTRLPAASGIVAGSAREPARARSPARALRQCIDMQGVTSGQPGGQGRGVVQDGGRAEPGARASAWQGHLLAMAGLGLAGGALGRIAAFIQRR